MIRRIFNQPYIIDKRTINNRLSYNKNDNVFLFKIDNNTKSIHKGIIVLFGKIHNKKVLSNTYNEIIEVFTNVLNYKCIRRIKIINNSNIIYIGANGDITSHFTIEEIKDWKESNFILINAIPLLNYLNN